MLNLRLVTWTTTVLTTLSYLLCVGVGAIALPASPNQLNRSAADRRRD